MYEIDDNVPIPEVKTGPGAPPKYPFASLKIGQSFFLPKGVIKSVSSAANYHQKTLKMRFTCRSVDGGVRVWRIK